MQILREICYSYLSYAVRRMWIPVTKKVCGFL